MAVHTRNTSIEPDIDQALEYGLSTEAVPYLRLWAAALYGGLKDYCQALDRGYAIDHPWMAWVLSDSTDVQSFFWMCDIMELNPIIVRHLATVNYKDMLHGSVGKKKRSQV